ncbi:RICIN domain-containing protein [Streptomyces olivochromogenes]|uniref:RICIN domain-containing protein n=1 Tax=Streptomyces olivochromogenes TaxID=1963 RepID=UPI003684C936
MTYVLITARRAGAVALALVSVLFLSMSSAQAATYQELRNARTLKCLAIPNSSQANGTEAIQWTCNDDTDQRWELHGVGDNRVRIINQSSGKCLNSGSSDGNSTWQWTCNDTPSIEELWIHDSIDRLRSMTADRCLAVPNSDTTNGVKPILWPCSLNTDQRWS